MIFKGQSKIILGQNVISSQSLEEDRQKWEGLAFIPSVGYKEQPDEILLRILLFETTPIIISSDEAKGELILNAELVRFPYPINGNTNYAEYAIRLIVTSGEINNICLDDTSDIAFRGIKFNTDKFIGEFGNSTLHLEIFYFKPKEALPPLTQRPAFTQERFV